MRVENSLLRTVAFLPTCIYETNVATYLICLSTLLGQQLWSAVYFSLKWHMSYLCKWIPFVWPDFSPFHQKFKHLWNRDVKISGSEWGMQTSTTLIDKRKCHKSRKEMFLHLVILELPPTSILIFSNLIAGPWFGLLICEPGWWPWHEVTGWTGLAVVSPESLTAAAEPVLIHSPGPDEQGLHCDTPWLVSHGNPAGLLACWSCWSCRFNCAACNPFPL